MDEQDRQDFCCLLRKNLWVRQTFIRYIRFIHVNKKEWICLK